MQGTSISGEASAMTGFILAIDQGTTSSRAIIFDDGYRIRGRGQQEFPSQHRVSPPVDHPAALRPPASEDAGRK